MPQRDYTLPGRAARRRKHSASEECGRKAGQLQMGRKGDSGPYSPDNVECATKEQKQKAQSTALSSLSPEKRAEALPVAAKNTGTRDLS
jgi:hypothetical protein